ncbi:uncharacterized protein STEHIDRAFT_109315 [Stereum hirsutum FP-91666 SS1]|uniref:uncharacterized protein n=1 Tax=Stereum hirsutum (strain FP-91666) TaxID=721885 RepID=UPI000440F5C5|nr:uncharacterized protein STEHIDRAFT_109315 [Stereum hirsutum FP-91666 SS1]EIM89027.1 hypothetical protein STEHIDRAFT_109315 [Stereum hirsutum FP-91666 SS1]
MLRLSLLLLSGGQRVWATVATIQENVRSSRILSKMEHSTEYWKALIEYDDYFLRRKIWRMSRMMANVRGDLTVDEAMRPITEVLTGATMGEWAELMENGLLSIACQVVGLCAVGLVGLHRLLTLINNGFQLAGAFPQKLGPRFQGVLIEWWPLMVKNLWDARDCILLHPGAVLERDAFAKLVSNFRKSFVTRPLHAWLLSDSLAASDGLSVALLTSCLMHSYAEDFDVCATAFSVVMTSRRDHSVQITSIASCLSDLILRVLSACSADKDFILALLNHRPLFKYLTSLLKDPQLLSMGSDRPFGPSPVGAVLKVIYECTASVWTGFRQDIVPYLIALNSADIFGALEIVFLQYGNLRHDEAYTAVGILEDLACVIKNEHRLLPFIRRQFPRPRLLRVLLDISYGEKQDLVPRESGNPSFVSTLRWAWALVDGLSGIAGIGPLGSAKPAEPFDTVIAPVRKVSPGLDLLDFFKPPTGLLSCKSQTYRSAPARAAGSHILATQRRDMEN